MSGKRPADRLLALGVTLFSFVLLGACRPAGGREAAAPASLRERSRPAQEPDTIRARYPKEWQVEVPAGTRLDSLRRELDPQLSILPSKDLEDRSPLPIWFRVYLRKHNPGLPTEGPYQYPRTATRLLRWMVAHPDSVGP